MPSLYVDRPFSKAIRDRADRIKRKNEDKECVSDREALYTMLTDEAKREVERKRDKLGAN